MEANRSVGKRGKKEWWLQYYEEDDQKAEGEDGYK